MDGKSAFKGIVMLVAAAAMAGYVVFILTRMARSPQTSTNLAVLAIALGVGALAAGLGLAGRRK